MYYYSAVADMNCSTEYNAAYLEVRQSYQQLIDIINYCIYVIITIGIIFNILNLVVLLKSKLNESPYTYLTMLSVSDLGALSMVAFEKIRQRLPQTPLVDKIHIYGIIVMANVFLSSSMYVTLALTIERFIFVHSPFKAMSICRRSIARRVCALIFLFSFVRSLYLPFMYKRNCLGGNDQLKEKLVDLYEFVISLALPYTIIFVANISLIFSLNKQNSLMHSSNLSRSSMQTSKSSTTGGGKRAKASSAASGPGGPVSSAVTTNSINLYRVTFLFIACAKISFK
jgi:hypothetical protein